MIPAADGLLSLGDAQLAVADVVAVARNNRRVQPLSDDAILRLRRSADWVANTVAGIERGGDEKPRAYYGVNTGFGAQAGKSALASRYLTEVLGRNLIASHTVGVGPWFDEETVRAILLLRAQSLAQGYSGVRPVVIQTLISILNAGIYPAIPQKGSLGASGDLAPLAHLALAITSVPVPHGSEQDVGLDQTDGEAFVPAEGATLGAFHYTIDYATGRQKNWRRVSGADAMRGIGGKLALSAKEALALLNGATVSAAIAALALHDAKNLLAHAELAIAMTIEAVRGFRDPFLPEIHAARRHVAAAGVASRILGYLEGSELVDPGDHNRDPARTPPQDPYSIRCAPQVLGSVADTLALVERWVQMDINAATDNPLIFPDMPRAYKAVSGGNFHGEPIAFAMDFLAIAITELASLSERRMYVLNEYQPGKPHGLPPFLVREQANTAGLNAGLMMLQATAAALISECKVLAHPDSVDSIPTSGTQEDHVSMSLNAARHASEVLRNAETVIAMELICAAQGIWLQKTKPELRDCQLGVVVEGAYSAIRASGIEPLTHDRVLAPDIARAVQLLHSGALISDLKLAG